MCPAVEMSLDSGSVAEPHVCGPQIPTGASEYRLGPSGSIHTKGGRLTSMKHGPLAQLSPVAPRSKKGIVGDHGGVVAASSPSAFRAPFLVGLKGTTGQCKSRKRSQSVPVAAAHPPFCFTLSHCVLATFRGAQTFSRAGAGLTLSLSSAS